MTEFELECLNRALSILESARIEVNRLSLAPRVELDEAIANVQGIVMEWRTR